MPYGTVTLKAGVNTEATATALRAGYAVAQQGRWRAGFFEKLGGFVKYYPFGLAGVPRALQAWKDLSLANWLGVGTTQTLAAISSGQLTTITPQTKTTDFAPKFSTVATSTTVTVDDSNIANPTTNDSVEFRTPVAVGGLILSGLYPIVTVLSATQYTITAASAATGTITNGGTVPSFATTSGSALVSVTLASHDLSVGSSVVFPLATTVGGVTIQGTYLAVSITSANVFVISVANNASSSTSASMNSGNAELLYYIAIGAASTSGTAYSFSTYSSGPYSGTGASSSQQTGTPIAPSDWTLDNWNATLMACPANGGVYAWTPNSGFQNAQLVSAGPLYNSGIFLAAPRLALVAYGSTVTKDIGIAQDPLVYKISDINDYTFWSTNVVNPTTGASSQAFESRLPNGNAIRCGIAASNQVLLWTDLDLWAINYVNLPTIWTQTKIGPNTGTVSRHGVAQMRGIVVWWGQKNFYGMTGGAPDVIPCTLWDSVFQNIDTDNLDKCWVEPIEGFSEFWFHYPSAASTGQCDLTVTYNITENAWAGPFTGMARSAGIGQSILGNPIMASPPGILYQHEEGYDADGQPLVPVMQSGYFYMTDGEDFVTVDKFLPDFKLNTYDASATSAIVQVTFYVADYFSATPRTYGPISISTTTEQVDVRFRGRVFAFYMTSTDVNTFWRLGSPKWRYSITGRR